MNPYRQMALVAGLSAIVMMGSLPSVSAATPSPRRGYCYNYSAQDVIGDGSKKGPVACTQIHTAETYRVGRWPGKMDPNTLDIDSALAIATTVCLPWKTDSAWFNYWAYYVPTSAQWKAGQRWIRCDAMRQVRDDVYTSFKGARLDFR